MVPAGPAALDAKLYIRHSQSTDVLTELGRQVNNSNLSPASAYLSDGAPRMGFSREPADFAFAAFVKTKSGDIDSTAGKNVLQAMNKSSGPENAGNSVAVQSNSPESGSDVVVAKNNSAAETSKGTAVSLSA